MKERQSDNAEALYLLEDGEAFVKYAREVADAGRRELAILNADLDPYLYDHPDFREAVSALARRDRRARVRLLVKDIRPLVESGHRLLTLARRLSSKVTIRRLTSEPENDRHAYLISDHDALLYQHDRHAYNGFANYAARPEATRLLEEFDRLWEHAEDHPALRQIRI